MQRLRSCFKGLFLTTEQDETLKDVLYRSVVTIFVFKKTARDDVGLNQDGAVDIETGEQTQVLGEAGLIGDRDWLDGEIGWIQKLRERKWSKVKPRFPALAMSGSWWLLPSLKEKIQWEEQFQGCFYAGVWVTCVKLEGEAETLLTPSAGLLTSLHAS